jgi:mRNA deadenylase 3'-5' endonuclease subunit Ccr4
MAMTRMAMTILKLQSCAVSPKTCPEDNNHSCRCFTPILLSCSFNAYCPPQFLAWQYRCPRLLSELEGYSADLLFLQEVESTVFDQQLQPWMQQQGYHSLFHPRRSPQGAQSKLLAAAFVIQDTIHHTATV